MEAISQRLRWVGALPPPRRAALLDELLARCGADERAPVVLSLVDLALVPGEGYFIKMKTTTTYVPSIY